MINFQHWKMQNNVFFSQILIRHFTDYLRILLNKPYESYLIFLQATTSSVHKNLLEVSKITVELILLTLNRFLSTFQPVKACSKSSKQNDVWMKVKFILLTLNRSFLSAGWSRHVLYWSCWHYRWSLCISWKSMININSYKSCLTYHFLWKRGILMYSK